MSRWIAAIFVLILAGSAQASPTGLRVAVYSGTGAASDKTLALYRAIAAAGHVPQAIVRADVMNGRLTSAHFDVLVLPAGEDGKRCCAGHCTDDGDAVGSIAAQNAIRAFVGAGGGLVAIEAGGFFACKNGGTLDLAESDRRTLLEGLALHYDAIGRPDLAEDVLGSTGAGSGDSPASSRVYLVLRGTSPDAASDLASRALKGASETAVNRNNYGITRLRAGDVAEARRSFERAIELDAALAGPYYNLAVIEKFYVFDDGAAQHWFALYRERSNDDPDGLLASFSPAGARADSTRVKE